MNFIRDNSVGARRVKVPCIVCGEMALLADCIVDTDGPAFKAYYCPLHFVPCTNRNGETIYELTDRAMDVALLEQRRYV